MRRIPDLDVHRQAIGEVDVVLIVFPSQSVLSSDAVCSNHHVNVGREGSVAASVDDGQASVRAGYEHVLRTVRARQRRTAGELEGRTAVENVLKSPADAGDAVDHHPLADLEAVGLPIAAAASDGTAVALRLIYVIARDGYLDGGIHRNIVCNRRVQDGSEASHRLGTNRIRDRRAETNQERVCAYGQDLPRSGESVDRDHLTQRKAVCLPTACGSSERTARGAAVRRDIRYDRRRGGRSGRWCGPGEMHDRVLDGVTLERIAESDYCPSTRNT